MALVEAGQLEDAVHHGAVALLRVEVEEMALGNDGDQAGGVDGLPAGKVASLSLLLLRMLMMTMMMMMQQQQQLQQLLQQL